MKLPKDQLEPIMTNSENIVGFGPNAYSKPATGLNILRETIMGREFLIMHLKNMQEAGHLNIQRLPIFSAQWKMQVVKTLTGSGEDGSTALSLRYFTGLCKICQTLMSNGKHRLTEIHDT